MEWVSLQKISIGLLVIFNDHITAPVSASAANATAAAARSSRCISEQRAAQRVSRFLASYGEQLAVYGAREPRTCAQEAGNQLACRSLSPWKFSIEKEDGRIPHEIARAECLYDGCIINQLENSSYNSVPVFAELMVLRKSPCHSDPRRFIITRDVVRVPVACTCAVPKYAK